jgi:electron transport complex protein RnfB
MSDTPSPKTIDRRAFLRGGVGGLTLLFGGALAVAAIRGRRTPRYVWQIDPNRCVQCGRCATECVLSPSAVKCVQIHKICGFCNLCFGYFIAEAKDLNTGAENQLCPTGALLRTFVEEPYYQYTIDEALCIGCGKCVKGCTVFGNGSLHLQILRDRCVDCNQCSIASRCPSQAITRVPLGAPYRLKGVEVTPPAGPA